MALLDPATTSVNVLPYAFSLEGGGGERHRLGKAVRILTPISGILLSLPFRKP